jgi:hypothetical protein
LNNLKHNENNNLLIPTNETWQVHHSNEQQQLPRSNPNLRGLKS